MKKTLLELQRELDDTENIIRACDTAQVYGLTLDSASFDKYNEALERQKALAEEISAYEQMRGGIITHTQMMRKEPELRVDECKVEDVVELPPAVFDDFTHSMLEDYDFIAERKTVCTTTAATFLTAFSCFVRVVKTAFSLKARGRATQDTADSCPMPGRL